MASEAALVGLAERAYAARDAAGLEGAVRALRARGGGCPAGGWRQLLRRALCDERWGAFGVMARVDRLAAVYAARDWAPPPHHEHARTPMLLACELVGIEPADFVCQAVVADGWGVMVHGDLPEYLVHAAVAGTEGGVFTRIVMCMSPQLCACEQILHDMKLAFNRWLPPERPGADAQAKKPRLS